MARTSGEASSSRAFATSANASLPEFPTAISTLRTNRSRPIRLSEYHEETAPLIAYYRRAGKLKTVDGMADIDVVSAAIEAALLEG